MPTTSPVGIDQRAAAVAGIEGGVGLDQVLNQPAALAAQAAAPAPRRRAVVTVASKPSGAPMAMTSWPRRSFLESPSRAMGMSMF